MQLTLQSKSLLLSIPVYRPIHNFNAITAMDQTNLQIKSLLRPKHTNYSSLSLSVTKFTHTASTIVS